VSPGVVRLVFNNNYTVSVYKDGQYLYKVPVYVGSWYSSGPWAPAQKLVIPVYWGPKRHSHGRRAVCTHHQTAWATAQA
jgi:hypothetical protein